MLKKYFGNNRFKKLFLAPMRRNHHSTVKVRKPKLKNKINNVFKNNSQYISLTNY